MKSFRQYTEEIKPNSPEEDGEDKALKSKEKRQMQIKKMVLLKKMQAVRAGAGADIVASYEPEGEVVEGLKQARKNVGADKCWDGYKAKGTKKKGGKEVPNCVKEEDKAFNYVVAKLKKQHGDGVLTKGDKMPQPSAAQKKKNAEIRAKRAKEDHRDPTEKASDGRYSDRYSNRGSD